MSATEERPNSSDAASAALGVQSVEAYARAAAEARGAWEAAFRRLQDECRAAVAAGVTVSKVARVAGVARGTLYRWLRE